jgi:hypothetical protein
LAIELDGDSHFKPGAKAHDAKRDQYISEFGISITRINNNEIYDNLDNVVEFIASLIIQFSATETPNPPVSPLGKGGHSQSLDPPELIKQEDMKERIE